MNHAAASPPLAAVELDALRLLTLVHQLGEPLEIEGESRFRGEQSLLALDFLLRHPDTLALLLLDAFERLPELGDKKAGLIRRLRWLLGAENSPASPAFRRARARGQGAERRLTFAELSIPWRRRDDALAHLTCRALLLVEAEAGSPNGSPTGPLPDLAFRITARGADLLEQRFYPSVQIAATYLKACTAIRELLPDWRQLVFETRLQAIWERLEALRREEQVAREQDVIALLFERTLHEKL